jgi:hypothetical protein
MAGRESDVRARPFASGFGSEGNEGEAFGMGRGAKCCWTWMHTPSDRPGSSQSDGMVRHLVGPTARHLVAHDTYVK